MIPAVMFRYMMNYGAFALVKTDGLDAKITSENAAGVALLDRNRHGL